MTEIIEKRGIETTKPSRSEELKMVFFWVWTLFSIVIFLVILTAFLIPQDVIASILPPCPQLVRTGKPCPLCGMTRAFYAISSLDFETALEFHKYSILLFIVFFVNQLVFVVVIVRQFFQRLKLRSTTQ